MPFLALDSINKAWSYEKSFEIQIQLFYECSSWIRNEINSYSFWPFCLGNLNIPISAGGSPQKIYVIYTEIAVKGSCNIPSKLFLKSLSEWTTHSCLLLYLSLDSLWSTPCLLTWPVLWVYVQRHSWEA